MTAYIVVVAVALALQIAFSLLYWKWFPSWVNNPYGRLAQLGAFALITNLTLVLLVNTFGHDWGRSEVRTIFTFGFLFLVAFGVLQLILLKRAVDSAKQEEESVSK